MRGKIHSTVAKSSNLRRECFVSLVCMTSVLKDMNRCHELSRKYWNDSLSLADSWTRDGGSIWDFNSPKRGEFILSRNLVYGVLNKVYFHQLGLLNEILSGMYALKSGSPVGLLRSHWRSQGEHQGVSIFPSLSFGTIARHTLFFFFGAPPSLPQDLNPALGVINCHHYHTAAWALSQKGFWSARSPKCNEPEV